MKPLELWNQLIAEGCEPKEGRIYPKRDIFVDAKLTTRAKKIYKIKYLEKNGEHVKAHIATPSYYSRFNQGVVTISLPDVSLSALKATEKLKEMKDYENIVKAEFWKIFDERLELCHKALQFRHQRLKGTPADVSPIHWRYGGLARLEKGETIDKLLYNGFSTLSLGFAGLYECVKAITGKSHTDPEAKPFALDIMEYMNKKTKEWKETEHIDYSLYGTPKLFIGRHRSDSVKNKLR